MLELLTWPPEYWWEPTGSPCFFWWWMGYLELENQKSVNRICEIHHDGVFCKKWGPGDIGKWEINYGQRLTVIFGANLALSLSLLKGIVQTFSLKKRWFYENFVPGPQILRGGSFFKAFMIFRKKKYFWIMKIQLRISLNYIWDFFFKTDFIVV